jgi:UDP-N-acetylmuramate--alanine ligase
MNLDTIKNVYFIGIGGIGMSALALYFLDIKKNVSGYDRTPSDITKSLEEAGVNIHYEDDIDLVPHDVITGKADTLIIYTPAIPTDHLELNYFLNREFLVRKRAKVLGEITKDKFTIAVGGTHGKTTTATMITHILSEAQIDCYALLGGIPVNYGTNYIKPKHKVSDIFVVEADEFDRSFLQLTPNITVITSTDADHLDVYENHENLKNSYNEFLQNIQYNGIYIHEKNVDLPEPKHLKTSISYGFDPSLPYHAKNISIKDGVYIVDIVTPLFEIKDIKLGVPGEHNILNALAALSVCTEMIHNAEVLKSALESFKGVKRRFEFIINKPNLIFIDDYAHHPTEINAAISTAKKLFPGKKITGIFQPHLFSRTQDFADMFAKVLSQLDKVVLLEIYPARELPIKGITSYSIYEKILICDKVITTSKCLLAHLKFDEDEVFLTLGAGDIDRLIEPIKEVLLNKK